MSSPIALIDGIKSVYGWAGCDGSIRGCSLSVLLCGDQVELDGLLFVLADVDGLALALVGPEEFGVFEGLAFHFLPGEQLVVSGRKAGHREASELVRCCAAIQLIAVAIRGIGNQGDESSGERLLLGDNRSINSTAVEGQNQFKGSIRLCVADIQAAFEHVGAA